MLELSPDGTMDSKMAVTSQVVVLKINSPLHTIFQIQGFAELLSGVAP